MKDSVAENLPVSHAGLALAKAPLDEAAIARWSHPATILIATDLTDLDRLMEFAQLEAAETGARLLLLHVLSVSASMAADAAGMPYYDPFGALEFIAKGLENLCFPLRQRGIVCEALVREGNAAQQIGAVARQFKADRLIVGTRSRSKLGKLLLGSVAEQVLSSVTLPVMTVGPEAHSPAGGAAGERVVLYATVLGASSRMGAMLAGRIAASQGAKLALIHVLPPTDRFSTEGVGRDGQPAGQDSVATHQMRLLAEETAGWCGAEVQTHVVHGNPVVEILAEAAERRASMVVLGVRHRSFFEDLTRDSTICRVLAHARCPVLTLRED